MMKLNCPSCGKPVLVAGIGALCPHCGELVASKETNIPQQQPPPSIFDETSPPQNEPEQQPAQPQLPPGMTACPGCGNVMHVEGLGAICPKCGSLVTVAPEEIEQLDPISAAEAQMPTYAPLPVERIAEPSSNAKYYIFGALIGAVVILISTLLILIFTHSSSMPPAATVVMPTPTPKSTSSTPPPSGGSSWFTENPTTEQTAPPPAVAMDTTPPPQPTPPPASKPAPPPPHAELVGVKIKPPAPDVKLLTDDQIGDSLKRGVDFLLSQFAETRLKNADNYDPETFAGLNALALYSLLHSGQALGDQRLGPQNELIQKLLDRLKEYPMNGNRATYSRSLRISALTVYNRAQDREAIKKDLDWLLRASIRGGYDYNTPQPGEDLAQHRWDNSNSQYGALGVWAAADAGYPVPMQYWKDVEQHWTNTQVMSGGWGYDNGATTATLSMTAAGSTMLFVARDQQNDFGTYTPLSKYINSALEWLDEGDHILNIDGGHRGYTCYGIERIGLASGYKFFGTHDWYVELARKLIADQQPDGSWSGGDGTVADTAFNLLFLSRGRYPIFMAKLRFDGNWSNRPRDVSVFTRFASRQLERPLNWQVADIDRNWYDWSDAPTLLITSDQPPKFKDDQIDKLRNYAIAGGLIFINAEHSGDEMNQFASDLAAKLFPNFSFDTLPTDHPLYSLVFPVSATNRPVLKAVSNGTRLLLIYSPADQARLWQPHPMKSETYASNLSVNIAVYSAGRRDLRNRLDSTYVAPPADAPIATVPIARLKYRGDWNPEPAAWPRMANVLQHQTGIALKVTPTDLADLKYDDTLIAHLTGTGAFEFNDADLDALRLFIVRGGTLLIDSVGGNKPFNDFIHQKFLPRLSPDIQAEILPDTSMILGGGLDGMKDLRPPHLRNNVNADPKMELLQLGAGQIVISHLDITSGLLGTQTVTITGYDPHWCQQFVQNLTLWAINRLK